MIQDIEPHKFDNAFSMRKPKEEDYALYFVKNQALLKRDQDHYEIPTFGDLAGISYKDAEFVFSIDDRAYFLVWGLDEAKDDTYEFKNTRFFRSMEPMHQGFAGITASQIWRWKESRQFCGRCKSRMERSKTERAMVCPACGMTEYPKISPAVIVAITNGDKLLMSRYVDSPYKGYALIAGFVEIGESFEATVRREVMEEVGLNVKNIRYFKSQPWAFSDTEMIGFFAELDGDDKITLQEDELSEAGWYTRDEIPDDELRISVGTEMKLAFKYGTF